MPETLEADRILFSLSPPSLALFALSNESISILTSDENKLGTLRSAFDVSDERVLDQLQPAFRLIERESFLALVLNWITVSAVTA